MDIAFSGFHRIDDGKIAETWVTWHNLATLTELGLWTPPALEEIEIIEQIFIFSAIGSVG
jgi:hypothetical protein